MSLTEIFIIIGSMVVSAIMGMVAVLLIGSKTSLNYFKVKVSRGTKVLIFLKTSFGWVSIVGKKNKQTLIWKYHKTSYITAITKNNQLGRFGAQECIYIDLDKPTVAFEVTEGAMYPSDFDVETFNNILIRMATRPNYEGTEDIKKKLLIVIIGIVVLIMLGVAIYLKAGNIYKLLLDLKTGGVL